MNTLESLARETISQSLEVLRRLCKPDPKILEKDRRQYLVYLAVPNVYYIDNYYVWNDEVVKALCVLSAFSKIVEGGCDFFGLLNEESALIEPGESKIEVETSIKKIYRVLKAFKMSNWNK